MSRATLAPLITAVRLLIDDTLPAESPQFSNDQIQDVLDRNREEVRYLDLAAAQTINPGGAVTWQTYYAQIGTTQLGDWEEDAVLLDRTWTPITSGVTADYIVGRWSFAASQLPPVWLLGKTFDRFAAAAELLEDWAATTVATVDHSGPNFKVLGSQQGKALLLQAKLYRQRMRARMIQSIRTDTPGRLWQQAGVDVSRTRF